MVDIYPIVIVHKILLQLDDVHQNLQGGVHEARVANVAQSREPNVGSLYVKSMVSSFLHVIVQLKMIIYCSSFQLWSLYLIVVFPWRC